MMTRPSIARAFIVLLLAAAGCAGRTGAAGGGAAPSGSRYDIAYRIAMPDPAAHLYEIQIDIGGLATDTLKMQQPVWSPGRYARFDFAKNVQAFTVTDPSGRPVKWDKENGSLWRVATRGVDRVRIRYRVFANTLSGSFSVLDTAHANWNGASLFMYAEEHKPDPVRLTIVPPAGWHVINGDARQPDQLEYVFPDYDHLIDTPTEVAPAFDVDSFRVDGRLYRTMVHHNGTQRGQRARFVRDIEKIVRYENTVIAPPPLEMYTFLFNIGYPGGDGMEHLYSTEIISNPVWSDTAAILAGVSTAAHEYFHTWNVKRIRPIALGPFDYTREQYQPSLWVAEGWTQYYGVMAMHRAGIMDRAWLLRSLAGMIRYNSEIPARKELSARMASFQAPFFDGAPNAMATDPAHEFISYYTKGQALAMLLDLQIRSRTRNAKSLDDVLRELKARVWDAPNASYYLQGRGYTELDVERAASKIAGADLHPWFERYVGGVEDLPWSETLPLAGLALTISGEGAGRAYVLDVAPDATPEQVRVRDGWLTGKTSATGTSTP